MKKYAAVLRNSPAQRTPSTRDRLAGKFLGTLGARISHLCGLLALFAGALAAQQPAAVPEGYVGRTEVKPGMAPKIKVTEFKSTGRRFEIVLSKGDEIIAGLTEFAEKNHIATAHFTAVGATDKATLGWFDPEKRAYKRIDINQEVEILNLTGNISTGANGKPTAHAHMTVALPDGTTRGGHLVEGIISLTLQLFMDDAEPLAPAPSTQKQ